jgi:hypothetical protein
VEQNKEHLKEEEIYFEGRLKDARSIRLEKVRKVLYLQLFNDGVISFKPSREIDEVFLEKVLFED